MFFSNVAHFLPPGTCQVWGPLKSRFWDIKTSFSRGVNTPPPRYRRTVNESVLWCHNLQKSLVIKWYWLFWPTWYQYNPFSRGNQIRLKLITSQKLHDILLLLFWSNWTYSYFLFIYVLIWTIKSFFFNIRCFLQL